MKIRENTGEFDELTLQDMPEDMIDEVAGGFCGPISRGIGGAGYGIGASWRIRWL